MEVNTNPFYESAANHMTTQVAYLEELIGRSLSADELENLHEFYDMLDEHTKYEFESKLGPLV